MAKTLLRQTWPGGTAVTTAPATGKKKRQPLWYALHLPALQQQPQMTRLEQLASCCLQVSDHVSLLPPATVLCEVAGSLRYFGGIEGLHQQLQQCLQQASDPQARHFALSPSASASALLAAHAQQHLLQHKSQLRSALGPLPITALPLNPRQQRLLQHSGLHHLRDLWRLPPAALRQRLGQKAADYLACCLGQRAEAPPRWQPARQFRQALDLTWPQHSHSALLQGCEQLLVGFCEFLRQHDLSCVRLQYQLRHEQREYSELQVGLRQPSRQLEQLLMLTDSALQQLLLPAAVTEIVLYSQELQATSAGMAGSLPGLEKVGERAALNALLDELQARLGQTAIQTLTASARHDPAEAVLIPPATASVTAAGITYFSQLPARPGWLIEPPLALDCHAGRPRYGGHLQLLSGPERLHTGWWLEQPLQRDYYVACNTRGQQLWIFRQLLAHEGERWYLHGLF